MPIAKGTARAFAGVAGTVNCAGTLFALGPGAEIRAEIAIAQQRAYVPTDDEALNLLAAELRAPRPHFELICRGTDQTGRWLLEGREDAGRISLDLSLVDEPGGFVGLEAPVLARHEHLGKPRGYGWPPGAASEAAAFQAWIGQISKTVGDVIGLLPGGEERAALVCKAPALRVNAFLLLLPRAHRLLQIEARDPSGRMLGSAPVTAPHIAQ